MYRIEIISNKSVEEDIIQALELYVPGILYTTFPLAYGRGGDDRKLGNTTWPEKNFVLVSYIEDDELQKIRSVIRAVKQKFKSEGIKLFIVKAEEEI
ncbi:PG0541 family transporter-associated protein [Treponema sp.]|uniref:PG0541 family transporter-associated protein n=1 Tax=Treponema sp. TaxID=166 RepID=UPI003F0DB8F9